MADQESIAKRAHELYLQRGSVPGHELDDWLRAEAELAGAESPEMRETAPDLPAAAGGARRNRREQAPPSNNRRVLRP